MYTFLALEDINKLEDCLIDRGFAYIDYEILTEQEKSKIPKVKCGINYVRELICEEEALILLNQKVPSISDSFQEFIGRK